MKKNYVVDTNVLLANPGALFHFADNDVYLPPDVLRELDKFKSGTDEINANARQITRTLERLTLGHKVNEGIALETGGKLYFIADRPRRDAPREGEALERLVHVLEGHFGYADDYILDQTRELAQKDPETPTILVTRDINLRIRARRAGLEAADHEHDKAAMDMNAFFRRNPRVTVDQDYLTRVHTQEPAAPPPGLADQLSCNTYHILEAISGRPAIVRYDGKVVRRINIPKKVEEIIPRNPAQKALLDALLDQEVHVVSALGRAGTGKTLLALAAAITQTTRGGPYAGRYQRIVVVRPIVEASKNNLGYLPGEVDDKIGPHFKPIERALDLIVGENGRDEALRTGLVEFVPINYLRGDTLHGTYVLVDEAQNFLPREIKTIGTRLGEGSKIVLCGDPFQVDLPTCDERSNGLTVMTDRFRTNLADFMYVILEEVERSGTAAAFAKYL